MLIPTLSTYITENVFNKIRKLNIFKIKLY